MTTPRAIIAAAMLIALAALASAWIIRPHYSMTNAGGGTTIRLNQRSGDMIGCERLTCRAVVQGDKIIPDPYAALARDSSADE